MGKFLISSFFNRTNSKVSISNDLIAGLEKDLEKLKRNEEMLRARKMRQTAAGR